METLLHFDAFPRLRPIYSQMLRQTKPTPMMMMGAAGATTHTSRPPLKEIKATAGPLALHQNRLKRYRKMCAFEGGKYSFHKDLVPPTYMSSLALPFQLALMVEEEFPFAPQQLRPLRERLDLHRTIYRDEIIRMYLEVNPNGFNPQNGCPTVEFVTEIVSGKDELVCELTSVFEVQNGHEQKGAANNSPAMGSNSGAKPAPSPNTLDSSSSSSSASRKWDEEGLIVSDFDVPDVGTRRFALAGYGDLFSGNYVSPWLSRWQGPWVAHRMWCFGRVFAAMMFKNILTVTNGRLTFDMDFTGPVMVPNRLLVVYDPNRTPKDPIQFGVIDVRTRETRFCGQVFHYSGHDPSLNSLDDLT